MKELTKAEEQIMQVLWQLESGFVKDVIDILPDPKPAYNTVSTIIRILEKKGFVGYEAYGKTHKYYPLIKKKEYSSYFLKSFVGSYFNGSFSKMVSFFAKENNLDLNQMEELLKHIKDDLNKPENE